MALCADQKTLEEVETDVLDLAETACDIVADSLGLTDDQVQLAFDALRVERHDMKLPTPVVAPLQAPPPPPPMMGNQIAACGLQAKAKAPQQLNTVAHPTAIAAHPIAVPPARVKLFKLGQLCCDAIVRYVEGNASPKPMGKSLQIDQRSTLERCREHLEWGGKLTTIWRFALTSKRAQGAYDALASYFVQKQRVGLVEIPGYTIYVVPPDEKFMKALGFTASKEMLGIQVPVAAPEGER